MNKIKTSLFISISLITSIAMASVLMSQWTDGTSRFCKYSNGDVIEISFGSVCPSTN